ncbi:hypothetical protein GCM10010431_55010 [Streptomyces kunmingensis]
MPFRPQGLTEPSYWGTLALDADRVASSWPYAIPGRVIDRAFSMPLAREKLNHQYAGRLVVREAAVRQLARRIVPGCTGPWL